MSLARLRRVLGGAAAARLGPKSALAANNVRFTHYRLGGNPQLLTDPQVKAWHDAIKAGGESAMTAAYDVITALSSGKIPPVMLDPKLTRSLWERQTVIMEK